VPINGSDRALVGPTRLPHSDEEHHHPEQHDRGHRDGVEDDPGNRQRSPLGACSCHAENDRTCSAEEVHIRDTRQVVGQAPEIADDLARQNHDRAERCHDTAHKAATAKMSRSGFVGKAGRLVDSAEGNADWNH